jgi:putative DNA primase/helicase
MQNWFRIAQELDVTKSLGKVIPIKIYKIAAVKFLSNYSKRFNLLLAKEGSTLYIYNGSFWDKIDEDFLKLFISMASIKLGIPKCEAFDTKFAKELFEQLVASGFFKKMNYPDVTLINLQNGTLEIGLEGIKLLPFNPYHFITYQLAFSFEPIIINTEWINFMNDILPDKYTQITLQQSLGYLFIQGLKLEKMIFLFGAGSNGKSVIYEVLIGLIGDNLITHHPLEILTNPKSYHRTDLANKLINYGSDIKLDKINPAELKVLASGEKTQVRQIYQEPFIMTRYAKFIFNINNIDNANVESTIGFFRRMIFIPFDKTIAPEKQDKFLHHRILMNKAGVLNWILEGAKQVIQNQSIFMSPNCYDFLDNFKKESNLAIRFMEDIKLVPSSHSKSVDFQVMYNKFVDFCKRQGERPLTQRIFNKELKKMNIPFERKNYGMVWIATSLK